MRRQDPPIYFGIEIRFAGKICVYIQRIRERRYNVQTMKPIITSSIIAVSLAFFVAVPSALTKEHEESISSSNVPAAVQQAAETQAKGGKIVRWEKEGKNYEAVIEKNGKQWGVEINASGKVLNKHDESKEHKEKGEKH